MGEEGITVQLEKNSVSYLKYQLTVHVLPNDFSDMPERSTLVGLEGFRNDDRG